MKNTHSPFNFRFYFVISCFFLFAIVLCLKLIYFQLAEGEEYKKIANDKTLKNFKVKPIPGNIPSPLERPSNCVFRTRCPNPTHECKEGKTPMGLIEVKPGHWVDKCCVNCG